MLQIFLGSLECTPFPFHNLQRKIDERFILNQFYEAIEGRGLVMHKRAERVLLIFLRKLNFSTFASRFEFPALSHRSLMVLLMVTLFQEHDFEYIVPFDLKFAAIFKYSQCLEETWRQISNYIAQSFQEIKKPVTVQN